MQFTLSALLFALLSSNSDAALKNDKRLGASTAKNPAPALNNVGSEMSIQKATKGAHDVGSFLFGRRAIQETVSYNVIAIVGSTEEDKQHINSEKKSALTEIKAKGLHSTENQAGAYKVTSKLRNKEKDEPTPTQSQIELNIVGGDQSEIGEFPYYVDMLGCGGTLIASNVVLGAAHCGSYVGEEVYVSGYQFGTVQYGTTAVKVVDQVEHPNYNPNTMENDFYLYKLESEVFPATQVTLTLNQDGALPAVDDELTVLGLGLLEEGGTTPGILNDVAVPTVSNEFCGSSQSYGSDFRPDVMLCAGGTQKDSCQGDSGGPIVMRNGNNHVLVGVVSWGNGCGEPNYPGIYARVSSAMSWIESIACDTWNSNGSFCAGGNGQSSTLTPEPNPVAPTTAPSTQLSPIDSISDTLTPSPPPQSTDKCTTLTLEFKTDSWPEETFVVLRNDREGLIWEYGNFDANTDYSFTACIPVDACTVLDTTDTFGDGLLDDGYMKVTWGSDVLYDDWEIGYGFYVSLGDGC